MDVVRPRGLVRSAFARSRTRWFAYLFAAVALSACGDAPLPVLEVADSSGITIVTNRASPEAIPETALTDRLLQFGSVEGSPEDQLFRVMDGRRLDGGNLLILNAGSQELRVYDAEGRFRSATGREGDGPGEYRFPYRMYPIPGDSLLIYDPGLRRFTVLGPDLVSSRTFTPSRAMLNQPQLAGLMGDSVAVTHEPLFDIPDLGFDTIYTRVAFVRLDGTGTDSLLVPGQRMGRIGPLRGGFVGSPFFEPPPTLIADAAGVWAGTGRVPEVSLFDAQGRRTRIVRWSTELAPVTDEDVALEVEARVRNSGEREGELRGWWADAPAAEHHPVYDEFRLDKRGRLWVREHARAGVAEGNWLVFGREGVLLRRVRMPATLNVLEIGDDYVLGVHTDELDVEYVQLWRLAPIG